MDTEFTKVNVIRKGTLAVRVVGPLLNRMRITSKTKDSLMKGASNPISLKALL